MMTFIVWILGIAVGTAEAAPKYGPNAVPLSKRSNTEYFQKNAAPDFWALIPYYLPQPTGRACSAAAMTLVLNGARSATPLTSEDKLLTIEGFVKDYTSKEYGKAVLGSGLMDRSQVTNQNVAKVLDTAAEKLKLKGPGTKVTVVDSGKKEAFLQALAENEKSADDFILFSVMQGTLTGDPEGGAHVAVVGAYDAKKNLALVLDPDREWYEPYWTPADRLFEAIHDPKADGIHPGWIHFKVR